jgi:hypothetical protein
MHTPIPKEALITNLHDAQLNLAQFLMKLDDAYGITTVPPERREAVEDRLRVQQDISSAIGNIAIVPK